MSLLVTLLRVRPWWPRPRARTSVKAIHHTRNFAFWWRQTLGRGETRGNYSAISHPWVKATPLRQAFPWSPMPGGGRSLKLWLEVLFRGWAIKPEVPERQIPVWSILYLEPCSQAPLEEVMPQLGQDIFPGMRPGMTFALGVEPQSRKLLTSPQRSSVFCLCKGDIPFKKAKAIRHFLPCWERAKAQV